MSDENKKFQEPEEEMIVTLDLDDGSVDCEVITILTVADQDYIALMPLNESDLEDDEEEGSVWFYRYKENKDDPNEEPELDCIEDDDEFERVTDAFDEYLDSLDYESM